MLASAITARTMGLLVVLCMRLSVRSPGVNHRSRRTGKIACEAQGSSILLPPSNACGDSKRRELAAGVARIGSLLTSLRSQVLAQAGKFRVDIGKSRFRVQRSAKLADFVT